MPPLQGGEWSGIDSAKINDTAMSHETLQVKIPLLGGVPEGRGGVK